MSRHSEQGFIPVSLALIVFAGRAECRGMSGAVLPVIVTG
jgi:hypothetical protein